MSEIKKLQFMDLDNFALAKSLLDSETSRKIDEKVSPAIKTVSQSEDKYTIFFYTKVAPVTEQDAVFSLTLPSPVDISGKADKVKNATSGNFAGLDSKGNLTDSGKKASDFDVAGAAISVDSALRTLIGTIPADAVAKNIVAYIQEAAAAGKYDDTALKALINKNADAITVLNGLGEGSVKKSVADAIAEVIANAPEDMDTLKEIADWISGHASDAAKMNSAIKSNTTSITTLTSLVGVLPEGATSRTVIEYIAEYVSGALVDSDLSQYAKTEDLEAAVTQIDSIKATLDTANVSIADNASDIKAINDKLGEIPEEAQSKTIIEYANELVNGVKSQLAALTTRITTAEGIITNLQTDMSSAKSDIITNATSIAGLQKIVGNGCEAIPEEAIRALFT